MPVLYSYFRSSSSFRVRIALHLKAVDCEYRYINLKPGISEQVSEEYLKINPEGKVPFYIDEKIQLSQSTAIIEFLEETYPMSPILPKDPLSRARVRQIVNVIACDIQPLNNISILTHLKNQFQADQSSVNDWYVHWISNGFQSIEALLNDTAAGAPYCQGETASMADIYLIPQVWNALRFNVPLTSFPMITKIYDHCMSQTAFQRASPEQQEDCV